jgi:hypothetical protein
MTAGGVTRREWVWALAVALAVVALAALPYLYAWLTTPAGLVYTGFIVNPLDGHSYLAKMQQGAAGGWLFTLPFTTEPQDGAYIYVHYLLLGHVAARLGLSPILAYHLARSLAAVAFLLVAYRFLACFVTGLGARRLTFIVVAVSSGLGWLVALAGVVAPDLWVPEANTFLTILVNPHFPLAEALILGVFLAVAAPFEWLASGASPDSGHSVWRALGVVFASMGLAIVQPFAVLTVYATLGAFLLMRGVLTRSWPAAPWFRLVLGAVASAPALAYEYAAYSRGAFAAWSAQNSTPSPSVGLLLVTYGLLWPLAVAGAVRCVQTRRGLLLILWAALNVVLLYLPFSLQRRMIIGLHLPAAILAAIGLAQYVWPRLAHRRTFGAAAMLVPLVPSTLFVLMVGFVGPTRHNWPLFMTSGVRDALVYLHDRTSPADVVLAAPETGLFIPAWAGNRVIYGHPLETIDAARKRAELESACQGQSATAELIRRYGVRYVFIGPLERACGGGLAAPQGSSVAYSNDEVRIYRVAPGG